MVAERSINQRIESLVSNRIALREIDFLIEEKILNYREVCRFVEEVHRRGKTVVLCEGTWDLTHAGHVQHIREARKYGDLLLLRLASAEYAKLFKGEGRPIEIRRDYVVSEFENVDAVWADKTVISPFDIEGNARMLARVNPDVITLETEDERLQLKLESVYLAQQLGSIIKPQVFNLERLNSTTAIINRILSMQVGKDK